jgi:Holliday junction resolvasome RuvABC endonuclease subunit
MEITGLDLAMGATGLCLPDGSVLTIKPKGKGDARYTEVRDHIRLAVRTSRTDLVVLESIQGRSLKGDAAIVLPMMHGAVRAMLMDDGVPYVLLNQSTLKKFATGNGGADKTAMALAAFKRAHLEFANDNECDAWWLHAAGMWRAERPVVMLPLPQRQALDVADWSPVAVVKERLRGRYAATSQLLEDPFAA